MPNRLVLCFDGTGNKFLGNESDTNIVKIYQLLSRKASDQFHYYQPGIGTYVEHQSSNSSGGNLWTRLKSAIATTVDQGVGTSFVHHVLAGYRFIMRYYTEGDRIYIFGFSRGAYTARFLSEMLFEIGLLSRGNEEMISFAWDTFSDYQRTKGNVPQTKEDEKRRVYMKKFKETFCRPQVVVYFLGLFDCVNSVGTFEIPFGAKNYEVIAQPPARYIRHAVSIHERRLKFKPALFDMDDEVAKQHQCDIKEVWFAGNHGDVGGGWGLGKNQRRLLSDTPLEWMLQELDGLPEDGKLAFDRKSLIDNILPPINYGGWLSDLFLRTRLSNHAIRVRTNQPHDMLAFGGGVSWITTLGWWILELLPIFSRLELEGGKWVPRHLPPNNGARRDIPSNAEIHPTVSAMYHAGVLSLEQMPVLGGTDPPSLRPSALLSSWAALRQERAKEQNAAFNRALESRICSLSYL
ncbi:hypothetical protein CC78DRAFT_559982 [Lojkania enalia]|uniref:T6SS Phospholipase effector Tle1-like catalytic domain-containing protein n=1 Tax=Lojkania enalia TaxID=147567 RepID=A0A9P4N455_9PLEO|nr:hypothetical protein CC78DRAFT_559982 [Didymosphaeria enalia]